MVSLKEGLQNSKAFFKEALVLFTLGLIAIGTNKAGYWVHPFIFVLSVGIVVLVPIVIVFKILMLL
jgi:membrane protein YdbS with pleckstrin-like domain